MSDETKKNKKISAAFVVVAIIVVASFLAVFLILREKSSPKLGNNRECPALAKICPDGKASKMNPETCEFEACPKDNSGQKQDNMVGNDRDEHGCIGSAGYQWCEEKQKCLRIWEESCETTDINTSNWKIYRNDEYGFKFKHSSFNCSLSQENEQLKEFVIEIFIDGKCPTLEEAGILGTLTFKYKYNLIRSKKYDKSLSEYINENGIRIKSQKNININDKNWEILYWNCDEDKDNAPSCYGLDIELLLKDDNKNIIYAISAWDESSAKEIAKNMSFLE